MNTQARIVIGALLAAVVALAVVLGIVLATDEGDGNGTSSPRVTDNGNDGFVGMMRAMDMMDSDSMLSHMRDVLGEAGYQRMLAHFRDHQNGGPMTGNAEVDSMMHQMMDGMLQHMPMDSGNMMPRTPDMQRQTPTLNEQDAHHETPTPRMTPTR
jgi:hypothetical protein